MLGGGVIPGLGAASVLLLVLAGSGCASSSEDNNPTSKVIVTTGGDVETFHRCPEITQRALAPLEFAFAGTLESIEGPDGVDWVFSVDRWIAGGDHPGVDHADTVVVRGNDVSIHYWSSTVRGPSEPGTRFLVGGTWQPPRIAGPGHVGSASACFTAAHTDSREAVYRAAFRDN